MVNPDSSPVDIYRGGSSAPVDVDDLIKYSQLIASTTTELMEDSLFQAPAPQEYQIQAGILYKASGFEAVTEEETVKDAEPVYKIEENAAPASPQHEAPAVISLDEVKIDKPDDDLDDLVWD